MTPSASPAAVPTALSRSARVLLVIGVGLAALPLGSRFSRQQPLRVELPPALRDTAHRLSVTWTRPGEIEPAGGFTLSLPAHAPPSVRREVSLPNGTYQLDIELAGDGAGRVAPIELRRNVTLVGDEVRIVLENAHP